MVSGIDKAARGVVARIIETNRLPVAATAMRDEKPRDAVRKCPLPHSLRSGEEPGVMQAPALPRLEKGLFGVLMADHHSHSASSSRISAVTSVAAASASTIRQRAGSAFAISTKRAASRA